MNNDNPNCNSNSPVADGETNFYKKLLAKESGKEEASEYSPVMMGGILRHNCGCLEEYSSDYYADECVADSIEYNASTYHNTCEYTMIPQATQKAIVKDSESTSNITKEDDIFPNQGS